MRKVILGGIAAIVIAVVAAVNVNLNSQNDNLLSDLALANVEALAQEGNTGNCPGGSSCSYSNSPGTCTVCCPAGKNPKCDVFGCTCY
jgi:hypothetical protein